MQPHREFGSSVWDSHLWKDINSLEDLQKAATRTCPKLSELGCHDLHVLQLFQLQGRRKQIKSGEAIISVQSTHLLGGSGGMPPQVNFAFLRWFLSQFQQNVSIDK